MFDAVISKESCDDPAGGPNIGDALNEEPVSRCRGMEEVFTITRTLAILGFK